MTQLFEKTSTNIVFAMPPAARIQLRAVAGGTKETGSGTKSPDNPYVLAGTTKVTVNGTDYALPQTLYSLPNGMADSYDEVSGAGTQNIKKLVLNGTESWGVAGEGDITNGISFYSTIAGMKSASTSIVQHVCDKLPVITYLASKATPKPLTFITAQTNVIIINIERSRLATQDSAGLKTWLAANPITMLYQLTIPITITGAAINPITLPAGQASITADAGTVSLLVYNEWTTPKTDWNSNDYFNLDPDYSRIKANIGYIKEFSLAMYSDFSLIDMGDFTIDGLPFDTFLNHIVDNVARLETNLFKPPTNQTMARYLGGQVGWDWKQLNIIENNILRLHDAMAGQWNLIPIMAFTMGVDEF